MPPPPPPHRPRPPIAAGTATAAGRRRAGRRASAALLAALALGVPAAAQDERGARPRDGGAGPGPGPPPAEPPAPAAEEEGPRVPYEVEVRGVEDDELRSLLETVSEAQTLADRPPATVVALRRRAQADVPRLLQALRSRGYYDAAVEVGVDATREPALVTFRVRPGPLYRLRDVVIETIPPDSDFVPPSPEALGLEPGQPAAARPIIDAEAELLRRAQRRGYALAELGDRLAEIERAASALDLTFRIEPGPRVRLGEVGVTGLEDVEEAYVRRRLQVEPGELYDPERLAAARSALVETGLFRSVRVRLGEDVGPDDRLPVTFELTERPHRSIGLGVRYQTDVGLGANASWEHRNLLGRAERFAIEVDASGLGAQVGRALEVGASFRKPDVLRIDQAFVAEASLNEVSTEAFDSRSIGAQAGLERRISPRTDAGLSFAYRAVSETDDAADGEDETFGLVSLPFSLRRDTSDDLLDPSEGGRLRLALAPFVDTLGSGVVFGKASVSYTRYQEVLDEPRLVLAGRIGVGSLLGADLAEVPADERFYAGGGGSIRGYGFQLAGPLNDDDDPTGGRSLLELSGELRWQFTETIGAVAFVDAGTAFEATVPDFDDELLVGAGVGVRYFTPVGPIRLDVGVPLNRRDVDDSFQVYISIGQAF